MEKVIDCRFESKKVNVAYYDCPDNFNCDTCSRLKPPEGTSPEKQKILPEKTTLKTDTPKSQSRKQKKIGRLNKNPRISVVDRRMAIKRLPEFKKEYEEFLKASKEGDQDLISQKMHEIYKKWGHEVQAIERVEELDEYIEKVEESKKPPLSVKEVTSIDREPIIKFVLREGEETVSEEWLEGERLYLEADIYNATKEELMKDFERLIGRYKKISPDKSRKRKFKLKNHWQIWDMHHKESKPLTQITKELFGVQGNPVYDGWSDLYRQVERAYKYAENIIKAVKPPTNSHHLNV